MRRPAEYSLATKNLLLQAVGLLLVVGVAGGYQYRQLRNEAYAEAARSGDRVGEVLRVLAAEDPQRLAPGQLVALLQALGAARAAEVQRVSIVDASLRVAAADDPVRVGRVLDQPVLAPLLRQPGRLVTRIERDGRPIQLMAYSIPARRGPGGSGDVIGVVALEIDLEPVERRITRTFAASMLLLGGLLGVFWVVQHALTRRLVGARLEALRVAAERLGRGDFEAPAQVGPRDEVGRLALAFNQMAGRVQQAHDELLSEVEVRQQAEAEAHTASQTLVHALAEVRGHNRAIRLLSEMSSMLQSCTGPQEAYAAIGPHCAQLFPGSRGALYLIDDSRERVETAARWGGTLRGQAEFATADCWALRRGQPHVNDGDETTICPHAKGTAATAVSLCLPMTAQNAMFGLFYLELGDAAARAGRIPGPALHLAETVVEQIALAISNLALRERLRGESIRDPLTGLYNRRYLEETLERELHRARRGRTQVCLVMLDVDHFKRLNDSFGHQAGDRVLRDLAQTAQRHLRASDVACRYGGEEFALVLPGASLEVGLERAEALRRSAAEQGLRPHALPHEAITLSLGVATFPDHGTTPTALVHAADLALYEAKRSGRDCVRGAAATPPPPGMQVSDTVP